MGFRQLIKYSFDSIHLNHLSTNFNLFIPPIANSSTIKFPILYYLAGLTCNEDTGPQKAGLLNLLSALRIAIVFPDTSPRAANLEGEDDHWDFGTGAGFYLDATHPKWKACYRMESLIVDELPKVLASLDLPLDLERQSIMGHSMGGHGALTIYLNHLDQFKSCSAFAPILNPTRSPWGIKAFTGPQGQGGYLAGGLDEGKKYDATELISKLELSEHNKRDLNILIDYGTDDKFYKSGELLPENFLKAMRSNSSLVNSNVDVREQDGYDHSYYFISTFAEDHVKFHAKFLL